MLYGRIRRSAMPHARILKVDVEEARAMPGVVAAAIITFIPTLGAYVTPDLMGGGSTFLIGNLLQQQFMTVRDWPFGSALGIILMVMVLAATLFYFRVGGSRSA
jgi:spermidine/putrescine transport system permease protein